MYFVMYFISIHSARVGGDRRDFLNAVPNTLFQSTPPVWAETYCTILMIFRDKFQSTPPVWAETQAALAPAGAQKISIHSARVGGDVIEKAFD